MRPPRSRQQIQGHVPMPSATPPMTPSATTHCRWDGTFLRSGSVHSKHLEYGICRQVYDWQHLLQRFLLRHGLQEEGLGAQHLRLLPRLSAHAVAVARARQRRRQRLALLQLVVICRQLLRASGCKPQIRASRSCFRARRRVMTAALLAPATANAAPGPPSGLIVIR